MIVTDSTIGIMCNMTIDLVALVTFSYLIYDLMCNHVSVLPEAD